MRTDEYHATDLLETGGSLEAVIKLIDDNARANTECMLACADSGGGESGDASLQSEKALEELSDEELLVLGKHAELLIRHELVMHPGWRLLAAYAHLGKLFKSTLNNRLHRNLTCVIDKSSRGAK